jgi:hypothetical protein
MVARKCADRVRGQRREPVHFRPPPLRGRERCLHLRQRQNSIPHVPLRVDSRYRDISATVRVPVITCACARMRTCVCARPCMACCEGARARARRPLDCA